MGVSFKKGAKIRIKYRTEGKEERKKFNANFIVKTSLFLYN